MKYNRRKVAIRRKDLAAGKKLCAWAFSEGYACGFLLLIFVDYIIPMKFYLKRAPKIYLPHLGRCLFPSTLFIWFFLIALPATIWRIYNSPVTDICLWYNCGNIFRRWLSRKALVFAPKIILAMIRLILPILFFVLTSQLSRRLINFFGLWIFLISRFEQLPAVDIKPALNARITERRILLPVQESWFFRWQPISFRCFVFEATI